MNTPLVSVILPVRNEARHIRKCLGAVLAQDYPQDRYEILVADGISTDGTREIVEEIAAGSGPIPVLLVDNPQRIVPTGLNRALERARGEIVIRVDGHTVVAPDYIRQCVSILIECACSNVGGRMNAEGQNYFGRSVALATSNVFGVGNARFHYSDREEWVDTVYLGAWKRSVFDRFGLFDEELVRDQDDEFNYRLRAGGGRILLHPRIRSVYYVRSSPGALWRQYFQYGFWKVRVLQKHPLQMKLRQFAPPAFAGLLILSILVDIIWPAALPFPISAALFLPYLATNLAASLLVSARNGWAYLPVLPIVYLILHFAYGLGFLSGLVRFAGRWGDRKGRVPAGDFLSARSQER